MKIFLKIRDKSTNHTAKGKRIKLYSTRILFFKIYQNVFTISIAYMHIFNNT